MRQGPMSSRKGLLTLAAMAAVTLLLSVSPAAAQDRLPSDLLTADSLSTEQHNLINLYIEFWTDMLRGSESTDEQVVTARARLIEPLDQPATSNAFQQYYPSAVAERLQGALDPSSLIARLNTMILVSHLGLRPQAVALVQQGLEDESPAVRYWAVKAIRTASGADGGPSLNPNTGRQLLNQLDNMVDDEPTLEVLEQVLLAMVDLDQPGSNALQRVVSVLNRRVSVHANQPRVPYRPETSAMQAAYRQVLYAQNRGGTDQLLNQIAAAAAKYMLVVANQAQQNELSTQLQADYAAMAQLTFTILDQIRQSRGVNAPVPSQFQFDQDVVNRNWDGVRQGAQQFRDMLTNPPFSFDPTDITVTR